MQICFFTHTTQTLHYYLNLCSSHLDYMGNRNTQADLKERHVNLMQSLKLSFLNHMPHILQHSF